MKRSFSYHVTPEGAEGPRIRPHPKLANLQAALDAEWTETRTLAMRAACSIQYAQDWLVKWAKAGKIERAKVHNLRPRMKKLAVYRLPPPKPVAHA